MDNSLRDQPCYIMGHRYSPQGLAVQWGLEDPSAQEDPIGVKQRHDCFGIADESRSRSTLSPEVAGLYRL